MGPQEGTGGRQLIEVDEAGRIIINAAEFGARTNRAAADDEGGLAPSPNAFCPQVNMVKGCGSKLTDEEVLPE